MSSPSGLLIDRLLSSVSSAQSVLFMGADGTDKYSRAQELMWGWLGVPEGTDLSRVVDLLKVTPMGPSRWIRRPQIVPTKVKQEEPVTPISQFVSTLPLKYKTKVVWIDEPERLYEDASNSLLKMLEEPPPHVRFVLTTATPSGLRATILSRCLIVACRPIGPEVLGELSPMEALFSEGDEPRLQLIRAKAAEHQALYDLLQSMPGRSRAAALKVSEEFKTRAEALGHDNARANHAEALRCLGLWLRAAGHPDASMFVVETHRRILGNGAAGMQLDSLFCRIMGTLARR